MIDLPSLFIAFGLLFGFVAGDAALYGDTLRVQIAVPQNVSNAGFNEASAEAVFMAEAARVVRGELIIPVPPIRVHSNTSVVTALAKPLNLDAAVMALQSKLGIDHLMVACAILAEASESKTPLPGAVRPLTAGTKLDIVVVVVQPNQVPVQTVLEQPDGDATTLVKRAADWAMEQVSPYRVVLAHFLDGVNGDPNGLTQAREAAGRFIAMHWNPKRASERAMTHNILSLLALLDGKIADAESQLEVTDAIPDVLPQARAQLKLNHSFIALSQKRPDEAVKLLAASREQASELDLPGFTVHLDIQEALVAWSAGRIDEAESKLRAAIETNPLSESAHHYLSMLLRNKGDLQGAAAETKIEVATRPFDRATQGLVVTMFWADPAKGGLTRRQ